MLGVAIHPQRRGETAVNATLSCPGAGRQAAAGADAARLLLGRFRGELYRCLTGRPDALFEAADAVLCEDRRVTDLARLSLVPEFTRGHGALYDGLNAGRVEFARLRTAVAGLPLPAWPDGRIRLAADVCNWLRPDAEASPGRLFCHVHGRGRNAGQVVPGWPYSFVAALGAGRSSWTLPLDAVRLGPDDDETEVTAAQLREVVTRLAAAGRWKPGDPSVIIVMDAGYSATRLAWLLRDLPVTLVARVRSDRVWYFPPPARLPGARGRSARHGAPVRCDDPGTWGGADVQAQAASARHGPLAVTAWARAHQAVHRGCGGWEDWPARREFPVIEGTLIRLAVTRPAPGYAALEPMWLWASDPDAGAGEAAAATLWQSYLRRFDLEHTFRFLKSRLGWDRPMLRDPAAADRWTWLVIACYAQLRLARTLAADIRLPWQRPHARPEEPRVMTPGRVRAGFRLVRETLGTPASVAKPSRPGPGRPAGSKNKRKAPRQPVGKHNPKQRKPAKNRRKKIKQTG
jgi:DDE superfamily endonuclease